MLFAPRKVIVPLVARNKAKRHSRKNAAILKVQLFWMLDIGAISSRARLMEWRGETDTARRYRRRRDDNALCAPRETTIDHRVIHHAAGEF